MTSPSSPPSLNTRSAQAYASSTSAMFDNAIRPSVVRPCAVVAIIGPFPALRPPGPWCTHRPEGRRDSDTLRGWSVHDHAPMMTARADVRKMANRDTSGKSADLRQAQLLVVPVIAHPVVELRREIALALTVAMTRQRIEATSRELLHAPERPTEMLGCGLVAVQPARVSVRLRRVRQQFAANALEHEAGDRVDELGRQSDRQRTLGHEDSL